MINDRGAGFISRPEKKVWQPSGGKGRPPKEIYDPKYISWGAAEYVANCHIGGALSECNKYGRIDRKVINRKIWKKELYRGCTAQVHPRFFCYVFC